MINWVFFMAFLRVNIFVSASLIGRWLDNYDCEQSGSLQTSAGRLRGWHEGLKCLQGKSPGGIIFLF